MSSGCARTRTSSSSTTTSDHRGAAGLRKRHRGSAAVRRKSAATGGCIVFDDYDGFTAGVWQEGLRETVADALGEEYVEELDI